MPCGARDRYRPQHAPERLPSCPVHFPHLSLSMSGPCSISSSLFSSPSFLKVPSPHGHLSLSAPTEVKQSPPSRLDSVPDLRSSSPLSLLPLPVFVPFDFFHLFSLSSAHCHRFHSSTTGPNFRTSVFLSLPGHCNKAPDLRLNYLLLWVPRDTYSHRRLRLDIHLLRIHIGISTLPFDTQSPSSFTQRQNVVSGPSQHVGRPRDGLASGRRLCALSQGQDQVCL